MKKHAVSSITSDILTVNDVANYLKVHASMVYRLIKRGDLRAFRVGSDWRFQRSDIDRWIEQQQLLLTAPGKSRRPRKK